MQQKSLVILALFLFPAIAPSVATACILQETPDLNNLSKYDLIFIGRVERVEVFENTTDLTAPHDLRFSIVRTLKGAEMSERSFDRVTGCGIAIPDKGDKGLIFVDANGHLVPAYADDDAAFNSMVDLVDSNLEKGK